MEIKTRKNLRLAIAIICGLIYLVIIIIDLKYRFDNPDMTGTRVFINRWLYYLAMLPPGTYLFYYLHRNN